MLGPHVNRYHAAGKRPTIAAHIAAACREAEEEAGVRVTVVSIFVGGPHDRRVTLLDEEGEELRGHLARTGIRAIAHSSYSAAPWRGDPDAARFIREEARACQRAGVTGLVVHLPKLPAEAVLKYAARLLDPEADGVRIYLETPAVSPRESYYETPAKLVALFRGLRERLDPDLRRFGLCVDTAHLWTCGVDLQSYEDAEAWLAELEAASAVIPPGCVMLHLNDSLRARGVGPDAHAGLAAGKMWESYRGREGDSGLAAFTDYAQRHGTPLVLERKPKEALRADYLILRELVPGARVPPAGDAPD